MSFLSILETIFIGPLKLVFEIIFNLANRVTDHPGLAIIFLSLIMNILVLPLYKRADAMQEQSRDIEAKLEKGVRHIKQTFSGDERMMILQTYYRQNNYKPTNALKGSVSLLLEIPFFMAAYQFLSHLSILDGVSLGPIADLGAPDGLLTIGGISINLLPVLMTLVNIISSSLYLKGFPLKTKIQLYAMALFFLVFLYTSPACLVFYWTLNNVFSLVKNIFYKLKNPKKVIRWLCAVCGVAVLVYTAANLQTYRLKMLLLFGAMGVALLLPLLYTLLEKKLPKRQKAQLAQPNQKTFVLGSLFLTLLIGVLIPSNYLASSPQEFVDITAFYHPIWYLVSSAAMAAGFFLVWLRVFYWLANDTGKAVFDKLVWVLCGLTFVNYMFFGTNTGVISANLQFEKPLAFGGKEQLINLAILLALALGLWLASVKWKKLPGAVLLVAVLALGCMSGINTVTIFRSVAVLQEQMETNAQEERFHIDLSKEGQNVVVIMLDRGMGTHVPYILQERPELKESFSGFTYYPNTMSFGPTTNFGVPPLVGGYDYTPVEMNKRDEEALVDKHNEALKMMPRVFSENGFHVTVCNPPYAGYQWMPDISIFDDLQNVDAYIALSDPRTNENLAAQYNISSNLRNFFCLGVVKAAPLAVQPFIYNSGAYLQVSSGEGNKQITKDNVVASGVTSNFMNPYMVLDSLPDITKVSQNAENHFLFMCNDTTHEPMLLQLPDYTPSQNVDNSDYLKLLNHRVLEDGTVLRMFDYASISHYQTNMATFLKLADWLDYLKEQGVYDNTRIIIAADHGRHLHQIEDRIMETPVGTIDIEVYSPLLLVKDFNATGFTTSETFMTNADVPTLAVTGVIENPVNPYTGNPISSEEKTAHPQYIILSDQWDININNDNYFTSSTWAQVEQDMRVPANWKFYENDIVLDEHAFPED